MSLLDVRNVTVRFGGLTALESVSLAVEQGEIFALVGPNGAGKSTLFNAISRFYEPASGEIWLEGDSLLARSPSEIAALGIARTFQNIELFERSTVLENLLIGRHTRRKPPSRRRSSSPRRSGGKRSRIGTRSSALSISWTFSPTGTKGSRASPTASARSWRSAGRSPWVRN